MENWGFLKVVRLAAVLFLVRGILSSSGGKAPEPWQKENVSFPMLNQQIRSQLEEHERQSKLLETQNQSLVLEHSNSKEWDEYQAKSSKILKRLTTAENWMQTSAYAYEVLERGKRIAKIEDKLFLELKEAPYLIPDILKEKVQWTKDFESLLRYLLGLSLTLGEINQIERADRKILFDFALEELSQLESKSNYLLFTVRETRQKVEIRKSLFRYYVARDKNLVQSIINQLKTLKS